MGCNVEDLTGGSNANGARQLVLAMHSGRGGRLAKKLAPELSLEKHMLLEAIRKMSGVYQPADGLQLPVPTQRTQLPDPERVLRTTFVPTAH